VRQLADLLGRGECSAVRCVLTLAVRRPWAHTSNTSPTSENEQDFHNQFDYRSLIMMRQLSELFGLRD
jgi:hypothetical protein